jgi:hypothetical protein
MKKLTVILLVFIAGALQAQSMKDDVAIIQSIWGKEKKALVAEYMKLSSQEEAGFWNAYDAYETQRKALGQDRIMLIDDYARNYGTLTDEKATELVNRMGQIYLSYDKLLLKTFKSMSKVISPVKAAQFVQLEKYITESIEISIKDNIPFIGELDSEMKK